MLHLRFVIIFIQVCIASSSTEQDIKNVLNKTAIKINFFIMIGLFDDKTNLKAADLCFSISTILSIDEW